MYIHLHFIGSFFVYSFGESSRVFRTSRLVCMVVGSSYSHFKRKKRCRYIICYKPKHFLFGCCWSPSPAPRICDFEIFLLENPGYNSCYAKFLCFNNKVLNRILLPENYYSWVFWLNVEIFPEFVIRCLERANHLIVGASWRH